MKRAKLTYEQLDKALLSLGFTCRTDEDEPATQIYKHEQTGALIMLPTLPKRDRVYEHHMIVVRITLDNFGIPLPSVFDATVNQAG